MMVMMSKMMIATPESRPFLVGSSYICRTSGKYRRLSSFIETFTQSEVPLTEIFYRLASRTIVQCPRASCIVARMD